MDAFLHGGWLWPMLAALVALDAPFPVVPSEPILMSASALAFGAGDAIAVFGMFTAASLGSVVGDLLVFVLGRTSRRVTAENRLSRWVCANVVRRPGVTLVGARFVPAGRLVSTLAAGRYGVSTQRFLCWSVVGSLVWAGYILAVGRLLGPLTHGDPLRSVLAGLAMAGITAGLFSLVERWRSA